MKAIKKTCAGCFRTLADKTRMRIIKFLQENGEHNVTAITRLLRVSQPTTSHHLRLLTTAGYILRRREGKEVHYSFRKDYPCQGCGIFGARIKV